VRLLDLAGTGIALLIVKRLTDVEVPAKPPTIAPKPLIPAPVVKPVVATRAEPITPFITVQQRAEQAAFQRRQEAMTRKQLLSRYGL
jgi:hypothetical protein